MPFARRKPVDAIYEEVRDHDLVHVLPDRVEVVDHKTDRGRHAEAEYRKQLGVHYHVVRVAYSERPVTTSLFYTATGDRVDIEPMSVDDLATVVASMDGGADGDE